MYVGNVAERFPNVIVASRADAGRQLVSSATSAAIRHVIAITDPFEHPAAGYAQRESRLRLVFHDLEEDQDFAFGPERHHIEALIAYARRIASAEGDLLIHCGAGMSRSPAAALIVLATWYGPGRERDAVEALFKAAPAAIPNRRMIKIADGLLVRNGALLSALDAHAAAHSAREST